mmetsp:Transcript_52070/g.76197  ORF Transcript_52070/g.76197 Transcript_52070/m.76197 type:complete len:104 (+) Transcript_52070:450-761(+)
MHCAVAELAGPTMVAVLFVAVRFVDGLVGTPATEAHCWGGRYGHGQGIDGGASPKLSFRQYHLPSYKRLMQSDPQPVGYSFESQMRQTELPVQMIWLEALFRE